MSNKLRLLIIAVAAVFMASCTTHDCPDQAIEIIPYPNQLKAGEGCVNLAKGFQIIGETNHAEYLTAELNAQGIEAGKGAQIVFQPAEQPNNLGEEGYRLVAKKKTITIEAKGSKGQFYGIQTLLQLVNGATVAAVEIEDVPAFGWRAYMLDESRYFHGETFVKQVLDQMAKLKMNVFHGTWLMMPDGALKSKNILYLPKLAAHGPIRRSEHGKAEKQPVNRIPGFTRRNKLKRSYSMLPKET